MKKRIDIWSVYKKCESKSPVLTRIIWFPIIVILFIIGGYIHAASKIEVEDFKYFGLKLLGLHSLEDMEEYDYE